MSNVSLPRHNFFHERDSLLHTRTAVIGMGAIFQTNLPSSEHRVTSRIFQIFPLTDDMLVMSGHTTAQRRAKRTAV
jgi:hypothetical protein